MMRVFNFLKGAGANPIVKAPDAINGHYSSLEELFRKTLEEYEQRCATLNKLADEARAQHDSATLQFCAIWTKSSSRTAFCLKHWRMSSATRSSQVMPGTDRPSPARSGDSTAPLSFSPAPVREWASFSQPTSCFLKDLTNQISLSMIIPTTCNDLFNYIINDEGAS